MLSTPTAADIDIVMRIAQTFAPLSHLEFAPVLQALRCKELLPDQALFTAEQSEPHECFVLEGMLRTSVGDAQGREITLGFHIGPGVFPPAITRMQEGRSRVDCTALDRVRVALFDPQVLSGAMVGDPAVRAWGDAVLRRDLMRKADREWSLAALSGLERLRQLRSEMPQLEERVAHRLIASYLGMTPVNFSRLRNQSGA
jgi:CRP-like cAMP-binding protein